MDRNKVTFTIDIFTAVIGAEMNPFRQEFYERIHTCEKTKSEALAKALLISKKAYQKSNECVVGFKVFEGYKPYTHEEMNFQFKGEF